MELMIGLTVGFSSDTCPMITAKLRRGVASINIDFMRSSEINNTATKETKQITTSPDVHTIKKDKKHTKNI
jgi:hypothetical protein